jgi:hypothetical protein
VAENLENEGAKPTARSEAKFTEPPVFDPEEPPHPGTEISGGSSNGAVNGAPRNGAETEEKVSSEAATGNKREAEEALGANGDSDSKKARVEVATDVVAAPDAIVPDAPITNGSPPAKKAGRPKKEKIPVPVGRTARKTRSQGPA